MPNADIWNDGDIFYSILGKSAMKLQNIKIWETMTLAGEFYYEFIPTIETSAKKPAKAGNVDIQSPKIIMTSLKLFLLAYSFEIDPWGPLQYVLLCIVMLQA